MTRPGVDQLSPDELRIPTKIMMNSKPLCKYCANYIMSINHCKYPVKQSTRAPYTWSGNSTSTMVLMVNRAPLPAYILTSTDHG